MTDDEEIFAAVRQRVAAAAVAGTGIELSPIAEEIASQHNRTFEEVLALVEAEAVRVGTQPR